MRVVGVRRCNLLQRALKIGNATGFKFESGNAEGGTGAGNIHDAGIDSAGGHDAADLRRDVEHVTAALGGNVNLFLIDRHGLLAEFGLKRGDLGEAPAVTLGAGEARVDVAADQVDG